MKVFKFSVDVDEKKATSFLKARNSKMMCKKDTIIVAIRKQVATKKQVGVCVSEHTLKNVDVR